MQTLNLKAFAKINLGLEVLNKMNNNFHNINTVFTRISLHDTISIAEHNSLEVSCSPDLNISQEENIVYKAAKLLQDKYNCNNKHAKITITKNIPSGAGLGGGSSDAAYTLIGLNKFWSLKLSYQQLHELATKLGSDVPFFLKPGLASAQGRGELLKYFNLSLPWHILVINPNIHISTKWAYQKLNRDDSTYPITDFKEVLHKSINNPEILKQYLINHFEIAVFEKFPEIKHIKDTMYENAAILSLLSGSGSTMFALFESKKQATAAAEIFPDYKSFVCSWQ